MSLSDGYEVGSQATGGVRVEAKHDASTPYEESTTDMKSPSVSIRQQNADLFTGGSEKVASLHQAWKKSEQSKTLSERSEIVPERQSEDTSTMKEGPTPGGVDGNVTAGNQEYEASSVSSIMFGPTAGGGEGPTPGVEMGILSTNATPGGEGSSDVFELDIQSVNDEQKKRADCGRIYPYRICLTLCTTILLSLFILCFIYYPKPVELCLKLSLDDEKIMEKVLDDVGNYKLNLTNPNSIDVDIHGLEISVYYGGVAEENWLLNAEKMDYHIPGHSTLSSNHTYTFTQNCTAAVPITTLGGCYAGYRAYITFDIVTSFKACVFSFVCHEGIVSKSQYKSYCPENDMVCTEFEIFQLD